MMSRSEAAGQGHGRLVRNLLDAQEESEEKSEAKGRAADEADEGERGGGIILGKKGKGGSAAAGKLPSKTEVSTEKRSR